MKPSFKLLFSMAVVLGITSFTLPSDAESTATIVQTSSSSVDAHQNSGTASQTHVFRAKAHTKGRSYLKSDTRSHPDAFHTVVFAVKQNNVEKLEDELMRVSDPKSRHYGRHWTREQVGAFTQNKEGSAAVIAYRSILPIMK